MALGERNNQILTSLGEYCQQEKIQTNREKIEQTYNSIWEDCRSQQMEFADKYAKLIEKNINTPNKSGRNSLELLHQTAREDVETISQKAEKSLDKISDIFKGFATQESAAVITGTQIEENVKNAKDLLKSNYVVLSKEAGPPQKTLEKSVSPESEYLVYSSNIIYSLLEKNKDALVEHATVINKEIDTLDNQKAPLNSWFENNATEKTSEGNNLATQNNSDRLTTRLKRLNEEKNFG